MSNCECVKEQSSQSPLSPGVVVNIEPIVYALVDPLTGSVKDMSKSQLKSSSLSVCRASYISGVSAKEKVVDALIAKDPNRSSEGFLWALCGEIRALNLGASAARAFCVIDDAIENYEAHAHIGYAEPNDPNLRNHREAARGNLLMLLNARGVHTEWRSPPFSE